MLITKTFKVRLYPNKEQEQKLNLIIDGCRFVWNHYLEKRKNLYLENQKTLPYSEMSRDMTQLRKTDENIRNVQFTPLQQSLRRLDTAYTRFFKKKSSFPRFKSRFDSRQSFQRPVDYRVYGNRIAIQRDLHVRFRGKLDTSLDLGTLTVSRDKGQWFASICVTVDNAPAKSFKEPIGIDMGVKTLATLSTGEKFENIKALEKSLMRLADAQKLLSRQTIGSSRYAETKQRISALHRKITNQRKDHIHNVTRAIVNKNPSVIGVEDLDVVGMLKGKSMSRALSDASFGEFLNILEYKQKWNGGGYIRIDRYFPSSKTCSECGYVKQGLKISQRTWKCVCGVTHDRDINAAKNILNQSLTYSERESATE